jgi:hypothetical protein
MYIKLTEWNESDGLFDKIFFIIVKLYLSNYLLLCIKKSNF